MSAITTINNKARDFWDRISPRERNLVMLAAAVTPLVIAFWLGSSIHDGLGAMEHHNERTRSALLAVEEMRAKGQTKPAVDDSLAAMTTDQLSLPTYIANAAKQANFELKSTISPRTGTPKGGFITSSASLRVEKLDLEQTKNFLHALETGSKVVAVTKLDLERDFRDKDKLTVDLEVSAYSREATDAGSGSAQKGSN